MISGSSVPFYVGRKFCLLAPVSMAEWETYELLQTKDKAIYLVYCAMHRAVPKITRRSVRWFLWRHKKISGNIIDIVCRISLPRIVASKKSKTEKEPTTKEIVQQIKVMFRSMSSAYGWHPSLISQMSPLQLYDYMLGGKDGTGVVRMTPSQYQMFRCARDL